MATNRIARVVSIFAVLGIVFAIAACGTTAPTATAVPTKPATAATTAPAAAPTAAPAAATTAAPAAAPTSAPAAKPAATTGAAAAPAAKAPLGITDDSITIGYHAGMTGAAAFMGQDALKAIQMYAQIVNDAGGINGRKFKVVSADDGYDTAKAIAADKRFQEVDKVFAVIGNVGTTNGVASSKTLNELGIPFIAPAAYSIQLHQPVQKYTYVLAPYWKIANEILGDYIVKNGAKKVAMIYQDDEAGRESADALDAQLKKIAGQGLVARGPFAQGAADFSSQIAAAKRAGADTVTSIANQVAVAAMLKEANTTGYKFQLYGSTAAADPQTIALAGNLAEGMRAFVFNPSPDETTPGMTKLKEQVNKFQAGYAPGFAFFNAYAGMTVLVDALTRAGKNFTMDDFLKAMDSTKNLETGGMFKSITFTPTNHSGHNYVKIVEVKSGKFVNVTDWVGQ